ncbi:uracil phosphoribosyltransferase [Nonlabens sp.]|uniref:DUF6341 family protein n=1 Tax=Nonlabens sp. TaxID=1888209 RepID=UPI00345CC12F
MGLLVLKKLVSIEIFDYFCSRNKQFTEMETLLDAIVSLFELILIPFDALRALETESWFAANAISWIAILILVAAVVYWMLQLKEYDKDEDKTQTGHSFLG